MKTPAFTALLFTLALSASADSGPAVRARTVYHANGTHTESIQDPNLHEQREFTYDQRNVLVSKKVYLLNDKGQTIQGNIYDGRDVLKARASFLFDDFGRMIEQRMSNLQGEVYQSILFTYDANGKPLPPKSRTYSSHGPDMKSAVIDFTTSGNAPAPMDRRPEPSSQGNAPQGNVPQGNAPQGNVPRLGDPNAKPAAGQAPAPTAPKAGEDPAKKPSFLQRLFKKDDKK